jgi:hypothetical protein
MSNNNKNFSCKNINNGIIEAKPRIIVIGDLHADYRNTIKIFKNLKLIDKKNNWIAKPKNTVVVQIGDQLDGGRPGSSIESSGELDLINFMEDIHQKALKYDGGVYSLIGNHEIMNLLGDFRYASNEDIELQKGEKARRDIFKPGGDLFNKLSCTRSVVLKVGDFLFAHAGVLPEHINNEDKGFIRKVNTLMRLFLQGKLNEYDPDINRLFYHSNGIIWNRYYGDNKPSCSKFNAVSKMLNVGHMIVGHTIQPNGEITSRCDNKLWRVDVGISDVFQMAGIQVLEILDNGVSSGKNNYKPMRIITIN